MGFLDNIKKMWESGETGKKLKKKKSLLDSIADGTYEAEMNKREVEKKKKKKKENAAS